MVVCVAQSVIVCSKGVDVGCLDLGAEAAAVAEAKVVCDDDEEIGSLFLVCHD